MSALEAYKFDYLEGNQVKVLPKILIKLVGGVTRIKPLNDPTIWVGDWLFNNASDNKRGTAGFFAVQRGKPVLVTCYHVLKTSKHPWSGLGDTVESDNQVYGKTVGDKYFRYIGNLSDGIINEWVDVAIVQLRDGAMIQNKDVSLGFLKVSERNSVDVSSIVEVNGALSEPGVGQVHSIENTVHIDYNSGTRPMHNLLCIKNAKGGKAITQPGDSGAVVVDSNKNVVAMIVAGNDQYSFAIPITRIVQTFGLTEFST